MTTTQTFQGPDLPGPPDRMRTALDICRYLLAGAAGCYLVIYIVLALVRLNYPYELEWMEGACVDHVQRILSGKSLYVEPSVDFTPFCYTPLYFYVCAAVAKVLGPGLLPLRLVSYLASLGCLLVLFQFVRRSTGSAMWGLISAGLYAATYRASGAWFDIARVDSLFMFFLLATIYLVRFGETIRPLLLAGLLMSLAFLTKQTTLIVALPLTAYVLLARRRGPALAFIIPLAAVLLLTTAAFNIATGGWYSYYVFRAAAYHDSLTAMLSAFWTVDLARPLGIALALSVFGIASGLAADIRRQFAFFAALLVGMLATSWLGRIHGAGYDNVLQPAYAFLAICFGIGSHALQSCWQTRSALPPPPAPSPPGPALGPERPLLLALYCVGLVQFALLIYSPSAQVPAPQDALAGDSLVETLKTIDGPVWIPYHGYLTALAGHPTFAHAMAINDVLRGPDGPAKTAILADIHRAITTRRFSAIVLDEPWLFEKGTQAYKEFLANYDLRKPPFDDKTVFWPVTGWKTRPAVLCPAKAAPPQTQP